MWKDFFVKGIVIGIIFLFVGAGVVPITSSNNSITNDQLDQEQIINSGAYWVYQCHYMAQEFKPTLNKLTRISLLLSRDGTPPHDLSVSIRNNLYTSDIVSKSIPSSIIPTYEDWIEIDFPDITVTPEESYYIVCKTVDGSYNPNHLYGWHCHENNPYTRGNMFRSTDCGSYWTESDSYNNDFCFKTYGYDNIDPPTISIVAPEPGYITGIHNFEAVANSDIGIDRVCFYVDGQQIGEDTERPYKTQLISTNYADGYHTLKAKAFDLIGQSSYDHVDYIFDNNKPEVTITNPGGSDTVSGMIYITVYTVDYGSGIEKVDFYIDDVFVYTDWSSPYRYSWDTNDFSDGFHKIEVFSYDFAGFDNYDSISVYVDNGNQPPNTPSTAYDVLNKELKITATDPDEDQIRYGISWNNDYTVDQWTEFVPSGTERSIDCSGRKGTVGVIAEDEHGAQSDWFSIKAKNKAINTMPLFLNFLENHPNMFPLLRQLLEL